MKYLCIDVGTTASKAQVFDENGNILFYSSKECSLKIIEGQSYADIDTIVLTVKDLVREASAVGDIDSIAFSSFGESFVLLDKDDRILSYPMLYTDARGDTEAGEISEKLTDEKIFAMTGTVPCSMYSISKLMWIKKNSPEKLYRAEKLMLICDYLGYLFTGKRVIDYSLAARTGIFDIHSLTFAKELLEELGIDPSLFSSPAPTGSVVGKITPSVSEELGLKEGCVLVLGSHDQVCATMGAGVIEPGQAADGMGTTECITALFEKPQTDLRFGRMGYPVVPFPGGFYCTYILNYTSNSVLNWFRENIMHGYKGDCADQFEYLGGSDKITDLLLLPYFSGCSTPYQDMSAKGAFLNLTLDTSDRDMFNAILEGTSYEMKLNFEFVYPYGINIEKIVATGGGAQSDKWLEIKSEIFSVSIKTLRSHEGGLCGLAMLSSAAMGQSKSLSEAKDVFVRYRKEFAPAGKNKEIYDRKFEKYKKLYPILKELY